MKCNFPDCSCVSPSDCPQPPAALNPSPSSTATPFGKRESPTGSLVSTLQSSTEAVLTKYDLPQWQKNDFQRWLLPLFYNHGPAFAAHILKELSVAITVELALDSSSTAKTGPTSQSPKASPSPTTVPTADVPGGRTGALCPKCRGTGNISFRNPPNTRPLWSSVVCDRCNGTGFIA